MAVILHTVFKRMNLNPQQLTQRDKLVLAGLYLSKFDADGLRRLGFDSFVEAFNVLGYALGGRPARIKNYRDEFDPLFPNARKGWHKRPRRDYCMRLFDGCAGLGLEEFGALIQTFVGLNPKLMPEDGGEGVGDYSPSVFTSRFVTGVAAENYFRDMQPRLPEFSDYRLEDTTLLGCGYDFCLHPKRGNDFLAVEVKGLKDERGNLSLTAREHHAAETLADRFILFVVKNFRELPFHEIYQAPLVGPLRFKRKQQVIVQINWQATV